MPEINRCSQMLEPAFALPRRHRAAQLIGLAGRETGGDDRELHDLLLEDRHAERALEHALHGLARIADRFEPLPPAQIRMHHAALDRARAARSRPRSRGRRIIAASAAAACSSARATRSGTRRRCRRAGSCRRPPGLRPGCRPSRSGLPRRAPIMSSARRIADSMPSASTSTFSRPSASRSSLSHWMTRALRHRGVFDRHQPRQRLARDHKAADMLRQVARKAEQRRRRASIRRAIAGLAGSKPASRKRLRQRLPVVPPRDAIWRARSIWPASKPSALPTSRSALRGAIADDRRGQRRAVAAVLLVDVLDHFLAPLMLEIDIDVGRLVALARNEALEQHAHARGIDLGDAQAIAHRRVGGRAAPLAQDVLRCAQSARGRARSGKKARISAPRSARARARSASRTLAGGPSGKRSRSPCFGQMAQPRRRRVRRPAPALPDIRSASCRARSRSARRCARFRPAARPDKSAPAATRERK